MLSDNLLRAFVNLACALSPENLTCDGEISPAAARKRRAAIMREWKALEKKAGRRVTEDEVWAAEMGQIGTA